MVEVGAAEVDGIAALEFEALSVAGNGETEGVFALIAGRDPAGAGRIDGDFIGDRAQGGQDAGAAHYDAVGIFIHHRQRHFGTVVKRSRAHGAATLQVDQGVGHHDVVFPDVLVVVEDVLLELRAVQA